MSINTRKIDRPQNKWSLQSLYKGAAVYLKFVRLWRVATQLLGSSLKETQQLSHCHPAQNNQMPHFKLGRAVALRRVA